MNKLNNEFSILAKTCTLMYNSQDSKDVILGNDVNYVIPIYQRPYSWTNDQLKKFIADIFISFWGNTGDSDPEPMFIGTMQLSARNGNTQDIIDGQQRLTTFLIFIKVLKYRYPDNMKLKEINLNWLSTKVNSGKQQFYLDEILSSDLLINVETLNPYLRNAFFINEFIDEQIVHENEDAVNFKIDDFFTHLLGNVYFVVIETRAGLSKTLQIFNAINTTGLDLNGGDIFKIRMYEYLQDQKNAIETTFDEISQLYHKIDEYNDCLKYRATDIMGILTIYQYIIIAKYHLPVVLYNYGVDRFFEELFDTILGNQLHDHFKNNVSNVELLIEDIDKIIEVRYEWEKKWKNKENFTLESACAFNIIWSSRYVRYWELTFVFLYKFQNEESYWMNMLEFNRQLSKLFFIYSIRFQKLKSDIYYGFMNKLTNAIVNESFTEVMTLINEEIGNEEIHNSGWNDLNWYLTENLTENAKRKNLICRLSAMLDEDYKTSAKEKIETIQKQLFETAIDIEHIQSYHDSNGDKREDIWNEWQDNINSLGNLMVLEQNINRSISNNPYEIKIVRYPESVFSIVKNHCIEHKYWDLAKCIERKEKEKRKILNYLFN